MHGASPHPAARCSICSSGQSNSTGTGHRRQSQSNSGGSLGFGRPSRTPITQCSNSASARFTWPFLIALTTRSTTSSCSSTSFSPSSVGTPYSSRLPLFLSEEPSQPLGDRQPCPVNHLLRSCCSNWTRVNRPMNRSPSCADIKYCSDRHQCGSQHADCRRPRTSSALRYRTASAGTT